MEIELPYKVDMSVNSMYRVTRQGKYLTRAALNLRTRIMKDVTSLMAEKYREVELFSHQKLRIGLVFTENWLYLNGKIRKADLDNRIKFIVDSVFKALKLDDKMIFELYARKNQTENGESTTIIISDFVDESTW